MKRNVSAKDVQAYINANHLPIDYINLKVYRPQEYRRVNVGNGQAIAARYNAILKEILPLNPVVTVSDSLIEIRYNNGEIRICRDEIIDKFLLPNLTN